MKHGLKLIWICTFIAAVVYIVVILDQVTPVPQPTPTATPVTVKATATPRPTAISVNTPVDPYVGMPALFYKSSWEWRGTDNTTVKDASGNKVRTTKYSYDTTKKSFTIWVNESDVVVLVRYSEKGGSSSSSGSGKKKSLAPTPNVSDYVDSEDFYDWYRDDFDDYEDAEDYYYSHGGK